MTAILEHSTSRQRWILHRPVKGELRHWQVAPKRHDSLLEKSASLFSKGLLQSCAMYASDRFLSKWATRSFHCSATSLFFISTIAVIIFLALRVFSKKGAQEAFEAWNRSWEKTVKMGLSSRGRIEFYLDRSSPKLEPLLNQCLEKKWYLKPYEGATFLHRIAKVDFLSDLVKRFFLDEACFCVKDSLFGNTPLLWAVANASNQSAWEILNFPQSASCVNIQDDQDRNTPLHILIAKGYIDKNFSKESVYCSNLTLVQLILEKGGNPNLQNAFGDTPLHLACARRDAAQIEMLMRSGRVNPCIKNREDNLPLRMLELDYKHASAVLERTVGSPFLLDADLHAKSKELARSALLGASLG